MHTFKQFITENKNTHMEHLEDSILNHGVNGTRDAINFLRSLRDMLAGSAKSKVNVSVKWDGAPAIFCGTDPSDGKFFVAKKGIFNKNPMVYKTNADIDADTKGKDDLNSKLKLALAEFPKLGIKGVVQGDFLYDKSNLKVVDIEGEPHITFHPNTIVYAVPKKSELGKQIIKSNVGVVWHTVYRGSSFEEMSASFGEEIANKLKKVNSIWSVDAVFQDQSGSATLTKKETEELTKTLSKIGSLFRTIPAKTLEAMTKPSNDILNLRLNTFINLKVREGQRIGNTKTFVKDFEKYLNDYFQKEIDSKKSAKGKAGWEKKRDDAMVFFKKSKTTDVVKIFDMYNMIVDAKLVIIRKLEKVGGLKTLLKTKDGYEVTGAEGFVAIDRYGKNALKLVDRLQFSNANFSDKYIKGWQK